MTCYQEVLCPHCQSNNVIKIGRTKHDIQRYLRMRIVPTPVSSWRTDIMPPHIQRQMVDMAINGSGIRDTARVLSVHKGTVMSTLKKRLKL